MTQPQQNNVKLGDVVRFSLPMGTAVSSGANLSGRLVNWIVTLTSLDNLSAQLRAADLVLLPPTLAKEMDAVALQRLMSELDAISAAALLIFHECDASVLESAEQLGFPLLILPEDTSLRELQQNVSAQLLDQQTQISERGMHLYRRLSEMSREGQGLMAMTEVMSKLTDKIIVVQDKRLEVRAMSRPIDSVVDVARLRQVLSEREHLPSVLRNRKAAAKSRQGSWHQLLPIDGVARLVSPIVSGDRARGYLSVIGAPDELDLLDTLTAEQGAAACALEMAKAKAISEVKKSLRGDFLEGLLAGTLPSNEIERLSGRLDHNTAPPHAVLVLSWDGENVPSMRRLETTINWLLSSHSRSALLHIYGGDHACVFQALRVGDDANDLTTVHDLDRRIREQVRSEYPGHRLVSGLSGPALMLSEWPNVYRQALQAMQLGSRLRFQRLVEYNSLGIFQLLTQLDDNPAVKAFAEMIVGPLAQYDHRHRSSLVQTMDAYFTHHGNISQTAEALFIHRNTLLYRLERIQELTKQDLNQSDMRLAMHLALKLWRLRPDVEDD